MPEKHTFSGDDCDISDMLNGITATNVTDFMLVLGVIVVFIRTVYELVAIWHDVLRGAGLNVHA